MRKKLCMSLGKCLYTVPSNNQSNSLFKRDWNLGNKMSWTFSYFSPHAYSWILPNSGRVWCGLPWWLSLSLSRADEEFIEMDAYFMVTLTGRHSPDLQSWPARRNIIYLLLYNTQMYLLFFSWCCHNIFNIEPTFTWPLGSVCWLSGC